LNYTRINTVKSYEFGVKSEILKPLFF